MKTHKWSEVRARSKVSPERQKQIAAEVASEVLEMNLAEVREAAGLTQVEVARVLEMAQSSVARLEKVASDHLLSTLRKYIEALGGEVKVQAVIKGKTVDLVV